MKISIVTVCYNSKDTIEQTIKSVIDQSYKSIEYIIIDGSSNDGTIDIIKKYDHHLSYWISEPDNGIYDAMNKGILAATGDVVGIINSDDWYHKNAVENVVNDFIARPEIDVVYGSCCNISRLTGREIHRSIGNDRGIVDDSFRISFNHPTCFIKRSVYMKHGLYDRRYKSAADLDLMIRFYNAGVIFYHDSNVTAYFRLGGSSSNYQNHIETKRIYRLWIDTFKDNIKVKALHLFHKRNDRTERYLVFRFLNSRITWASATKHRNKKIVIFGAGMMGKELYDWLFSQNRHDDVVGFIDNSPIARQEKIDGKKILSVEHSLSLIRDAMIVIAVLDSQSIEHQLELLGLVKGVHFLWIPQFKEWITGTQIGNRFSWITRAPRHNQLIQKESF